jgi:outer membrane protein TolC
MSVFRFSWLLLVGLPLAGWSQAIASFSLPQALEVARTNYPTLHARQASITTAAADVRTVCYNYLPQLTA